NDLFTRNHSSNLSSRGGLPNIDLNASNVNPFGMEANENFIWVVDNTDDRVYKYATGIDPLEINVELSQPLNGASLSVTIGTAFVVNHSSLGYNLQNTTYSIWFSNGTLFNRTTYDINETNITKQRFLFDIGNFIWNAETCGENATATFCDVAPVNFSFDIGSTILNNIFPRNVSETESATFMLNLSLIPNANLFAARLNYNGTRYLASKTAKLLESLNITISGKIRLFI
ncbi:hypothetical protein LCGC14_2270980, partial [marine sediment metagenome]